MTEQEILVKIMQYVVLLFALSLHEAAHAWTASRLGDQTARMLGRITLNPVKHIDPIGTVLIPLVTLFAPGLGGMLIGWAKPTPVTTRNFTHIKRDDVLTTLAGPASNFFGALVSLLVLVILAKTSLAGSAAVHAIAGGGFVVTDELLSSRMYPIVLIFYISVFLNLVLAIFNLLPLPPLDGSHIVRNMLPYNALRFYDSIGMFSIILILFVGGRFVGIFVGPLLYIVRFVLLST
jgi:Zn-dependent protease